MAACGCDVPVDVMLAPGGKVDVVTADLMRSLAIEKKNAQLAALKTFDFVKPDYLKHFPQKNPFKQRSAMKQTLSNRL